MKTIILAGGYATRLQPLTLNQPKPLLNVADKPIMSYLMEKLEPLKQVDEVYVITNDKFHTHFEKWKETIRTEKEVIIVNDQTLSNEDRLGSLGDIQFLLDQYAIDDDIFVLGGDNLFCAELDPFLGIFTEKGNVIGLHDVGSLKLAQQYGNVEINDDGKITRFTEKPKDPKTTLSSTLIWALKKEILPHIQHVIDAGNSDHAGDLIADIYATEEVYGYTIPGKWFDIGTLDQLEEANAYYKKKEVYS